jgi:hypothetical protein
LIATGSFTADAIAYVEHIDPKEVVREAGGFGLL